MRNIMQFHKSATAAVERSSAAGRDGQESVKITFNTIKQRLGDLMYKITSQKFEDPTQGEQVIRKKLAELNAEIIDRFRALEEEIM